MFKVFSPAEGVKVIGVETNSFKTGEIIVSMAMPMGNTHAANAVLLGLLKHSCEKFPNFSLLNGKLDDLYGASLSYSIAKQGDSQVLKLHMSFLDDRFALNGEKIALDCCTLLADMIFFPNVKDQSFGEEQLNLEKRLLIQLIEEENDDKRLYARNKCIEHLCYNELYAKSKYGTKEEIGNLTMGKVFAAWQDILKTALFGITVVGSCKAEEISEIFKERFSSIDRRPVTIETKFSPKPGRSGRHDETQEINQGKLVIGFRTCMEFARDRMWENVVMNDIFGGGTYSYLFSVIREKMNLAYYCRTSLIASKGLLVLEAGIDTDKEKAVTAGIIRELNNIRLGKATEELLQNSKRSLKERYTLTSPEAIAAFYDQQFLLNEILTPEEAIEGIEKVTLEDVKMCAKSLALGSIFMLCAKEQVEKEAKEQTEKREQTEKENAVEEEEK